MRGRVSKPRACRSLLKLPKAPPEKQLDAIASRTPELPPGRGGRSPAGGGLAQDTTALQSSKRPLDRASTNDSSPAKRARLTRTDVQRRAGPSRRSARLQGQKPASIGNPIRPSTASFGRQLEAGAGTSPSKTSPSKQPGLTKRRTQREAEDEQTEQAIETVQRPKPPKQRFIPSLEARAEEEERASPATLSRKRQINGSDNEHQLLKRARLTWENLAEFDRMGKKGASKASASAAPESTIESSSTKTTSTTTSGFAIQAYKNGILDPLSSKPPTNIEDIRTRYAQSRGTASPNESIYEDYVDTVGRARNEATMVFEVGGQLLKKYPREGYNRVFNQAFTSFPKDAGFNSGLSAPQPDFIEGLEMPEYRPFPVDEHIKGAVLYKDDPRSLVLPHIAGEWKGRGKDMEEARLQSAYDGAALVYARNEALKLVGKPDPPGRAEVTTFTTDGTTLNLFAHYAAPSEDGTLLEYHQYPIKSTSLVDSHQGLKDSRRGLRNEQDYARTQSYAMRDQLKERWKQRSSVLHPIAEAAPAPVADGTFGEINEDENEPGYVVVEQPCQPTPAASSSVKSSESAPPVDDNNISRRSGHKRKASSSQGPSRRSSNPKSRAQEYWKWDATRRQYFHRHSDGKVTWLEDSDDEN